MTVEEYKAQPLSVRFENEKNAKNEAYRFILESGLIKDFAEWRRKHDGESGNDFKACADAVYQNTHGWMLHDAS